MAEKKDTHDNEDGNEPAPYSSRPLTRPPTIHQNNRSAFSAAQAAKVLRPQTRSGTIRIPGGANEHGRACVGRAEMLALCSSDESKGAALEVIKLAVGAMLGQRGGKLPPPDSLLRLHAILRGHNGRVSRKHDIDDLPEGLIRDVREQVVRGLMRASVDRTFAQSAIAADDFFFDPNQVRFDAICSKVVAVSADRLQHLRPIDCSAAIEKLRQTGRRSVSMTGVVADILIAATGGRPDERDAMLKRVNRAVSGRKAVRRPTGNRAARKRKA